jgi:hypothetical protein
MVIRQNLHNHCDGFFALRLRWSFEVQLVFFSANLANYVIALFGGHAQNLQFSYPSGNIE